MNGSEFHELRLLAQSDARQRTRREVECSGKHAFESFAAADRTIRRDLRKAARAYHCGSCHAYHVGGIAQKRHYRIAKMMQR